MNDDFLRRLRRPPSAAFERQLRERLRQQEREQTSRRRPGWKLPVIALLIGGSALATATYLALSRSPSSSPATQTQTESASHAQSSGRQDALPEINRWIMQTHADTSTHAQSPASGAPQGPIGDARENRQSPTDASRGGPTEASTYISSTGAGTSAAARPTRVVVSPDIEPLTTDTSPGSTLRQTASFEVESADTALPALCAEERESQPDVVVTSRRVRQEELKLCKRPHYNGEVLEATLGHIATVVTRAKTGTPMQLSSRTLRLALLKQVPAPDNSAQLIDNPYTHWNQIDPELEDRRIEVLGPARDSAEFVVFAATLLTPACEHDASVDPQLCQSVREDGVYKEARFDSNFIRQRLWSDPNVVAVMDYRLYAANSADLLGSLLPGAAPTRESIVNGNYVGARTLHAYVNRLRHRNIPRVYSWVNDYLRMSANLQKKVLIPPDGDFDARQPFDRGPKLTAVKLD